MHRCAKQRGRTTGWCGMRNGRRIPLGWVSAALAGLVLITGLALGIPLRPEAAGFAGMSGKSVETGKAGADGAPGGAVNGTAERPGKAGRAGADGFPDGAGNAGSMEAAGYSGAGETTGNVGSPGSLGYPGYPGSPGRAGFAPAGPSSSQTDGQWTEASDQTAGQSSGGPKPQNGIADIAQAPVAIPVFAGTSSDRTGGASAMVDAVVSAEPTPSALLVALGDSVALGIGDEEGGGFVERLRDSLETLHGSPIRVTNLAVNGHRSDQLLDLLKRREEARQSVAEASMIAVSIGGNDLARVIKKHALHLTMDRFDESRARFAEHLAEIVDMLTVANESADIYLIGLFNPLSPWFSDIPELADVFDGWNRTIRETAEAHERVYYVPVDDLFAEGGPDYTADDFIHPNGAGHGLIADRALEAIAAVKGEGDGEA